MDGERARVTRLHDFFSARDQHSVYVSAVGAVTVMVDGGLVAFRRALCGWTHRGPAVVKADHIAGGEADALLALEKCVVLEGAGLVLRRKDRSEAAVARVSVFFPRTQPHYLIDPLAAAPLAHSEQALRDRLRALREKWGLGHHFASEQAPLRALSLEPDKIYLVPERRGFKLIRQSRQGHCLHAPFPLNFLRPQDAEFARQFVLELAEPPGDPLDHGAFLLGFLGAGGAAPVTLWDGSCVQSREDAGWTPRLRPLGAAAPAIHVVPRGL